MQYTGKIKGEFEETQSVEADSIEEATEKLGANLGETIDRTATGTLSVSDVEQTGD